MRGHQRRAAGRAAVLDVDERHAGEAEHGDRGGRAYVLYLDGEPVAFWQGQAYNGVFSTGVPGLRPRVRRPARRQLRALQADRRPLRRRVDRHARLRLRRRRVQAPLRHAQLGGAGRAPLRADGQGLRTNAIRSALLAAVAGGTRVLGRNDRARPAQGSLARPALARRRRSSRAPARPRARRPRPGRGRAGARKRRPRPAEPLLPRRGRRRSLARADLVVADGARRLPRLEPVHHARERERPRGRDDRAPRGAAGRGRRGPDGEGADRAPAPQARVADADASCPACSTTSRSSASSRVGPNRWRIVQEARFEGRAGAVRRPRRRAARARADAAGAGRPRARRDYQSSSE